MIRHNTGTIELDKQMRKWICKSETDFITTQISYGNKKKCPRTKREITTLISNKTALRVLAKIPAPRRSLIFWTKDPHMQSNWGLPSISENNCSFSSMRLKDWIQYVEARTLRTGTNDSYAARQTSACVCIKHTQQQQKVYHHKLQPWRKHNFIADNAICQVPLKKNVEI